MPDSWNLPPVSRTPALDFLRRVEVWQQDDALSEGTAVTMPAGEELTLHQLLDSFRHGGSSNTAQLETQARSWLIGYRELFPPLTDAQRTQLNSVIDGMPSTERVTRPPRLPLRLTQRAHYIAIAVVVIIIAVACGVLVPLAIRAANPDNPVQHGAQSQQHPQQVAPGTTDLENLQSDWGPWQQLAASEQNPQTRAPALLLLNQGGYYASKRWTVPSTKGTWTADLAGHVQSVSVHGRYATITDADGTLWVAGVEQPFVFAADPNTILKIDRIGTVLSTTTAHAIATRVRI